MSKIEPRLTVHTVPAPARVVRTDVVSAAPAAAQGDSLQVSGAAKTAERMRAITREMVAWMDFRPRTSEQANTWLAQGRALQAEAAPRLKNGDLRSLPLKERQTYTIGVHRLESFLEDAPSLLRHFKGE